MHTHTHYLSLNVLHFSNLPITPVCACVLLASRLPTSPKQPLPEERKSPRRSKSPTPSPRRVVISPQAAATAGARTHLSPRDAAAKSPTRASPRRRSSPRKRASLSPQQQKQQQQQQSSNNNGAGVGGYLDDELASKRAHRQDPASSPSAPPGQAEGSPLTSAASNVQALRQRFEQTQMQQLKDSR